MRGVLPNGYSSLTQKTRRRRVALGFKSRSNRASSSVAAAARAVVVGTWAKAHAIVMPADNVRLDVAFSLRRARSRPRCRTGLPRSVYS